MDMTANSQLDMVRKTSSYYQINMTFEVMIYWVPERKRRGLGQFWLT